MHVRLSRRAWLVAAAALTSIITMVGIPLAAGPASASTDTWTASGPAGTFNLLSDGADSNPSFSYYYCPVSGVTPGSSCNSGGALQQTWTFDAAPQGSETQVTGTYLWTGNHSYCSAFAKLQPFTVSGGVTATLPAIVNEANSCNPDDGQGPIFGNFEFSGQFTFNLSGVMQYGFLLSGSNGDHNSFLQGTFTFETVSPPSPAPVQLAATAGNGAVNLSWTAPSGPSPNSYLVFEGTTPGVEVPDPVDIVSGTTTTAEITTESEAGTDQGPPPALDNGSTYYFTVVAVFGAPVFGYASGAGAPALASPPSNEMSATLAANLIQNGGFESPAVAPCGTAYDCSDEGFGDLTPADNPVYGLNWTIGGAGIDLVNNHWQAEDGSQSVDLAGTGPGWVSQTVTTVVGETYTLSWWMAGNPDNGAAIKTMDVYWNGTLVDEPTFNTAGYTDASMGWVEEQLNVTATSTSTNVEFADASSGATAFGATLDNVSLLPANSTVSAALSVSSPTVEGVETVPASAVPASSVDGSTGSGDAASAPLDSIPLDSIGLGSAPLDSIPLDSIPLDSIAAPGAGAPSGLEAAAKVLSQSLLSEIGITYPEGCNGSSCTGWQGVLAGSIYAGAPLESVTLADVVQDTTTGTGGVPSPAANFATVDLGSLDLASSPLDSIPLDSIALGAVPLDSIPLATATSSSAGDVLTAWCNELAGISVNFQCSNFGITDPRSGNANGVTLLTLALAGVPLDSIPLDSIPLDSIPLDSIPLDSIPLDSINLASNPLDSIPLDSINLASNPLDSIPLDSIPAPQLALLLSCDPVSTCGGTTLAQAAADGYIQSDATLGDILNGDNTSVPGFPSLTLADILDGDNTSVAGYPSLTLEDLVLMTTPPASYPWQAVTLPDLPLAADETAGGTVAYTATFTVSSTTTVEASVSLPATFAYVPNSSTLDGTPTPDPSPTDCAVTGGQTGCALGWALNLSPGTHTLTFKANAGIGLGSAAATLSTSISGNSGPSSIASVDVVDGEEPAVNSSSTAPTLVTGTPPATGGDLNIGYITSPEDVNDWAVTVPAGSPELSLALTNLPATYDLELFGPSAPQLQGTPSQDLSGVTDTLPSILPGTTTEATPGSQDLPVTPPAGDQLMALSNNPDGQDQDIQTPPLAAGTYIVQVSGYNGAFSSQPYLLRANLLGGATAPTCPGIGARNPAIPYLNSLPVPAAGPVSIPSGVNTLFLVDTQRLAAAFPSGEPTIMSDLEGVASDSAAGVNGAVIPVDAYPSVQAAYTIWNENPCSVDAANGVVAAIAAVVDQVRADNPTVQNLVIVGADDQIPFARIADGATESNERDYGASAAVGQANVEADALSLGYYFSDDPYAASQPLGVGSATLYAPQLAVGRLVESASEIEAALTRFVSSDGSLNANASLTTGYSFLTSGADAVEANLSADGLSASALINETWQDSDLDSALAGTDSAIGQSEAPGVDSINAHFDYSRALPAYDNTNGITTGLFTTTDVRNAIGSYTGRLLFSMGCHAGLDVDDAEVDGSVGANATIDDWAKTFADAGALWVANTGYGYADTDTIAYSAKLMADFAANLNGTLTIGEALSEAKQQYAGGNAILSPYDLKALMESTFYGLPMYTLNGPTTPVNLPTGPKTTTDGPTGLTVAPVSVSFGQSGSPAFDYVTTGTGDYYEVSGTPTYSGGTQTTEYRPIEPLVSVPVTEAGMVPHGALVTALSSTDTADPTPAYSMPAAGAADASPPAIGDAAFPGTLQRVATYGTFTATGTGQGAQLDLISGQFLPNPSSPGDGTERLFNSISAQVYYVPPSSPLADDYTPAAIDSTQATTSSGSAPSFVVQVTPANAPVKEVLVLYTDGAYPGAWTSALLSSNNGLTWTGTGSVATTNGAQYIVEAVDAAGNVAVSNNEGVDFNGAPQPSVSIELSGSGPVNGYYTGNVTASITAPGGSTYVLDGSQPQAVPTSGQLEVSASGEHTLTVTDKNGDTATQAFAISTSQTTTTLSSNPSSAVVGQQVAFTATVAPASSGAGSPTGSVEFFDGTSPVTACGGTNGEVLTSGTAICEVAYSSPGAHQVTASYLGNANFAGSSSGATGLTVGPDLAKVSSFTVSGTPVIYGAETGLVFSATVTAGNGASIPSTDTVTVTEGSIAVCTITLSNVSGSSATGTCSPSPSTVLPAGTSGITATFNSTGADPDFVAAPPAGTTLTVSPAALKITAVGGSLTYGGTVPTIAAAYSGFVNGDSANSLTTKPTCSTTATGSSPVGVYTSSCSGAADPNYAIAYAGGTVTVKPAPLTITASTGSMTYGGAPPTITASYSGFVNADSATRLTTKPTCSTAANSSSQPGTYASLCTGAVDANYTIAYVNGTVTVGFTQACITATDSGSLTVAKGQVICIGSGGKVTGSVAVAVGGALWVSGGSIGGSLSSTSALGITLCGTTVTGSVSVTGTSGPVVMGGSGCAKDTLGGSLSVTSNPDGIVFSNDAITGSVAVSSNAGGTTISADSITGSLAVSANAGGTTVSSNTVTGSGSVTSNTGGLTFTNNTLSGSLSITNNTGVFVFSGNTVHGSVSNTGNT
jgi:choice-of-anchor C domain-containing protein